MYNDNIFTEVSKYVESGTGKVSYTGILIASKLNQKNGQDYPLLDAIDIDWNGAYIASLKTYLRTTEDLIGVLDTLNKSNETGALTTEVNKIWNQINEITSTYVTYSYLQTELETNWQGKLTPGDNIIIENNIISVVDLPTYDYLGETYVDWSNFNYYKKEVENKYYDKNATYTVAYNAAYDAIIRVIDGADNAFDTLKEISDWILDQTVWTEISGQDVIDDWEDNKYYDLVDGEYVLIDNKDNIDPSKTYYFKESYLVEIQNLLSRVNNLDTKVGDKKLDDNGVTYTYTGLYKDIYDLQREDQNIYYSINSLNNKFEITNKTANTAYTLAYDAIVTSTDAYTLAYDAYEIASSSSTNSQEAYTLAYTAIVRVGEESTGGCTKITYYEIEGYANDYYIYSYNSDNKLVINNGPYDEETDYYVYLPVVEGTGLTKRVEDAEKTSENALTTANTAYDKANKSLFNLYVNNEEDSYVNLSLSPSEYYGSPNRTISVSATIANFDSETGEMISSGLVDMNTAFNIYSYALSWMTLGIEEDSESEEN